MNFSVFAINRDSEFCTSYNYNVSTHDQLVPLIGAFWFPLFSCLYALFYFFQSVYCLAWLILRRIRIDNGKRVCRPCCNEVEHLAMNQIIAPFFMGIFSAAGAGVLSVNDYSKLIQSVAGYSFGTAFMFHSATIWLKIAKEIVMSSKVLKMAGHSKSSSVDRVMIALPYIGAIMATGMSIFGNSCHSFASYFRLFYMWFCGAAAALSVLNGIYLIRSLKAINNLKTCSTGDTTGATTERNKRYSSLKLRTSCVLGSALAAGIFTCSFCVFILFFPYFDQSDVFYAVTMGSFTTIICSFGFLLIFTTLNPAKMYTQLNRRTSMSQEKYSSKPARTSSKVNPTMN